MRLNTHLSFNGQCEAAFKFYEKVLDGKITFSMTWGEMPGGGPVPPGTEKRIMHTALNIGEATLMGADSPPDHYEKPQGFSVSLHLEDISKAERIFNALAENGSVRMSFQKTFWSPGFGMCVDQFGIPWMVNTEQAP